MLLESASKVELNGQEEREEVEGEQWARKDARFGHYLPGGPKNASQGGKNKLFNIKQAQALNVSV